MSRTRLAAAVVLALVAAGTAVLLVATQYGLVAEYGGGGGVTIIALAAIPVLVALLSARLAGWGRRSRVGVAVFTVALAVAMVAAIPLGGRAHDQRTAAEDRNFACNGPNAEIQVDERVDDAFRELPHPAPLYGPVEGSRYGCTAGIDGPADQTFGPWREVLLASGWTVADDGERVTVTRDDLVATLAREGGTATLRITAGEPPECLVEETRADEGEVVAC